MPFMGCSVWNWLSWWIHCWFSAGAKGTTQGDASIRVKHLWFWSAKTQTFGKFWKTLPFRLSCWKTWPRAVPVFFSFFFSKMVKVGTSESWESWKHDFHLTILYLLASPSGPQVGVVGATGAVGEEMIEVCGKWVENVKLEVSFCRFRMHFCLHCSSSPHRPYVTGNFEQLLFESCSIQEARSREYLAKQDHAQTCINVSSQFIGKTEAVLKLALDTWIFPDRISYWSHKAISHKV